MRVGVSNGFTAHPSRGRFARGCPDPSCAVHGQEFRLFVKIQIKLQHRLRVDFALSRELKSESMQKLRCPSDVNLRVQDQFETAMEMGMVGRHLHQALSNEVAYRVINCAKAVQMSHFLVLHANADGTEDLSVRICDPKVVPRMT